MLAYYCSSGTFYYAANSAMNCTSESSGFTFRVPSHIGSYAVAVVNIPGATSSMAVTVAPQVQRFFWENRLG